MTRKVIGVLSGLTLLLASAAMAQTDSGDDQIAERMLVAIPFGWAPAQSEDTQSNVGTVYSGAGRDQIIVVQRLIGAGGGEPALVGRQMARQAAEQCEAAEVTGDETRVGSQPAYALAIVCTLNEGRGEVTRALFVKGEADMHLITRVWRGDLDDEDAPLPATSAWDRFFGDIGYCPTGGC